jgi:hypothetical protein
MRYTVLEEAERAVVEIKQHTHTIALLVAACFIVVLLAVAVEGTVVSVDEPAIRTFPLVVFSCRVKIGPADADQGVVHTL